MLANSRGEIVAVFDALGAALDRALELDFGALTTPERLALLQRCETVRRRLPAVEHPLINELGSVDVNELGGKLPWKLADELRISRGEARRRIDEAADLGPRHAMTGEPLTPVLPGAAAAQRDGELGAEHLRVIRGFWHTLPAGVDPAQREEAEIELAGFAADFRPDELARLATKVFDRLVPDGLYDDDYRAKRRGVVLGRQDPDGMTPIRGHLTPEARATLDAVFARWAGPGMCNPEDPEPCLSGTPSQQAIERDHRGANQRHHDALIALGRAMLASGKLGAHNGLPASVIISVSLAELEAASGKAHTGGGTWLPMTDVIRLAGHAHLWLRIFSDAKEVALYHTKRLASPGQRIVLYARDRGCAHPNCPVAGYLAEVHHTQPYCETGRTDIDDLTFRCGCHHELITTGGWKTRKRASGDIETLPPPHLDRGQARLNTFHHPEKLLRNRGSRDSDDDLEDP